MPQDIDNPRFLEAESLPIMCEFQAQSPAQEPVKQKQIKQAKAQQQPRKDTTFL